MRLFLIITFILIFRYGVLGQTLVTNKAIDSLEFITADELSDYNTILNFKCKVDSQLCADLHYKIQNMKRQSWYLKVLDTVYDCNVAFEKLDKQEKSAFEYQVEELKYKKFHKYQKEILLQIFDTTKNINISGKDSASLNIFWDKPLSEDLRYMKLYRLKTKNDRSFYTLIYTDVLDIYYLFTVSKDLKLIDFITLLKWEIPFNFLDKQNGCYSISSGYIRSKITNELIINQKQGAEITDCKTGKVINHMISSKMIIIENDGKFKVNKNGP